MWRKRKSNSSGGGSSGNGGDKSTPAISSSQLVRCSHRQARLLVPRNLAESLGVLPLGLINVSGKEILSVAYFHSNPLELQATLRFAVEREVKLIAVPEQPLRQAIFSAYRGDDEWLAEKAVYAQSLQGNSRRDISTKVTVDFAQTPLSEFLQALIEYAIARKASDIHIVPTAQGPRIQVRIHGELRTREEAFGNRAIHDQLLNQLKVLAHLDISKHQIAQEGSFSIQTGSTARAIRLSVMPTIYGQKAVMRLCADDEVLTLDNLGFDARTLESLRNATQSQEGAVLFAGSTGSGKTTSMYSMLNDLKDKNLSLVSIEDPVETRLSWLAQTEVNYAQGMDYVHCLKTVLRQDPDAILLGEIRDAMSAQVALQAALTGHLLLSTVHARGVFEVLLRLRSLGVDSTLLSQSIHTIVCQRLYVRLCQRCRVIDLKLSEQLGAESYRAVGCEHCDLSGADGRILVPESLTINDELRAWIAKGDYEEKSLQELLTLQNYTGYRTILEDLVAKGMVSSSEAL